MQRVPAEAETLPRLEGFTAVGGASETGVVVEPFTAEKGDEVAGGSFEQGSFVKGGRGIDSDRAGIIPRLALIA